METQMLLLEAKEEYAIHDGNSSNPTTKNTFYILFLPVLDGPFQTSLQGTPKTELQLFVEIGKFNLLHIISFIDFLFIMTWI